MTRDEIRDSPRTPEGGQAAKAIAICLNGNKWRIMNDEIQIYEIIVKQKIDCE